MSIREIEAVLPGLGRTRIHVLHACLDFHCGWASGPGYVVNWWAERSPDGWTYLWDSDALLPGPPLEAAIEALLPRPADLARAAQDAAAEGPQ